MTSIKARNSDCAKQVQPFSENVPRVPFRAIYAGPSGCGKTEAIVSTLLDLMRTKSGKSVFQYVVVMSPSVHVDRCWEPVKRFVEEELKVDTRKEQCFFETFDEDALMELKTIQERIVKLQRARGDKTMFGVLVVIDDFADDPKVTRQSHLLWSAYVRGRHCFQSTLIATQGYRMLSPIIRKNCTDLLIWKARNALELKALLEENSAIYPPGVLEEYYRVATQEPYSFLYLKLTATDPDDVAWLRFERRMSEVVRSSGEEVDRGRRK